MLAPSSWRGNGQWPVLTIHLSVTSGGSQLRNDFGREDFHLKGQVRLLQTFGFNARSFERPELTG